MIVKKVGTQKYLALYALFRKEHAGVMATKPIC